MSPFSISIMLDTFGLGKFDQNRNPSPPRTLQGSHDIIPIRMAISQPVTYIHKPGTFLGLPAGIRHKIYTEFLTEDEIDARTLDHGPNDRLNLLLTCKQIYYETRPIVIATQPAFLDLWSGSWNFLLHARCRNRDPRGCMLGSARIPAKVSHHMPVENIRRLVLRHFNWNDGSAVKFLPINRQTFQRLRPEEIHLHGYYCGNKLMNDLYFNFLAAIPFLTKIFGSTDRFIAYLCMDQCYVSYGFETEVAWAHYSVEIVSGGLGHGWELAKREYLERGGVRLVYTVMNGSGNDEALVRTVIFEMRLLVLDEYDGCMEGLG
jgi:hypothetical protein